MYIQSKNKLNKSNKKNKKNNNKKVKKPIEINFDDDYVEEDNSNEYYDEEDEDIDEIVIFKELTLDKIKLMDNTLFIEELYKLRTKEDLRVLSRDLFRLLKELLSRKYHNIPWEYIETEYFRDKNLLRRYILIKSFIFDNNLAGIIGGEIEGNLIEISDKIDFLPEGVYDLRSGEKHYGKNSTDYERFYELIDDYSRRLTYIFQRLSIIYAEEKRKEHLIDRADDRSTKKIRTITESGGLINMATRVGSDVESSMQRDESILRSEELAMEYDNPENEDIFEANEKNNKIKNKRK